MSHQLKELDLSSAIGGSPSMEDVSEKPLDAFTQELVRENELLIADVDQLRENEDRLIEQVTALQMQVQLNDGRLAKEVQSLTEQLAAKEAEHAAAMGAKGKEMRALKEDLVTTQHTLTLLEESSQAHHEQMEQLEQELEEAREEIARLHAAAEEALAAVKEGNEANAKHAAATAEAVDAAIASTLTEMNANVKFMQATIQSIFKSIRGTMLFSLYGDAVGTPFEGQPTPTLSITERDAAMRDAELAKMHKKICDTVRRVEGFATMGDARSAELNMNPADHPLRTFIGTSVEACTLLVSLYSSLGKIGLSAARNRYSFADSSVPAAEGGAAGGAESSGATKSPPPGAQAAAPAAAPSRGLGLWAR